jgi:hypothetical protein
MRKRAEKTGFSTKPGPVGLVGTLVSQDLLPEGLDGDRAAEDPVSRLVHDPHGPGADDALEEIAALSSIL